MSWVSPNLDTRDAAAVSQQLRQRLATALPQMRIEGLSEALIEVFARYCEIIIQRINNAPAKAVLNFVNLLGASLDPPQPARVPLTFVRASGGPTYAKVPKGTQVAALPTEHDTQPVIFQTEQTLDAMSAVLTSVLVRDPRHDQFGEYHVDSLLNVSGIEEFPLFHGNRSMEHILYLGYHRLSQVRSLDELRVTVHLKDAAQPPDARLVQWELWDGHEGLPIAPQEDRTDHLRQSGDIVFRDLSLQGSDQTLNGVTARWVRCRLLTPLVRMNEPRPGVLRVGSAPTIESIHVEVVWHEPRIFVEAAFVNKSAIDVSKESYLFGEKPTLGDVLYLGHKSAFSRSGATVTLHVDLVNPRSDGELTTIDSTRVSPTLRLEWDIWTSNGWRSIGQSEGSGDRHDEATGFHDTTQALSESGTVQFTVPATASTTTLNGVTCGWIRARIASGNYGAEGKWEKDPHDAKKVRFELPTLAPPMSNSLWLDTKFVGPRERPDAIMTANDFVYDMRIDEEPFLPFIAPHEETPSLHCGFTLPTDWETRSDREGTLMIYLRLQPVPSDPKSLGSAVPDVLIWEYWDGAAWAPLHVRDETQGFRRSEIVWIRVPSNWKAKEDFRQVLHWIRIRDVSMPSSSQRRLVGMIPNTVMATQTTTVHDELLGRSRGLPGQPYQTLQKPVLPGQLLEVHEPSQFTGLKSANDWTPWTEMSDFCESGPDDRHYRLDRLSGLIEFGDGHKGRIPPVGKTDNIRMRAYQTGGGARGNTPPATLTQLKTTVPYVQKVSNIVAATGGSDAETVDALVRRAPRVLRHKDRAVTKKDYEDLAARASSDVARVWCLPICHLGEDPLARVPRPGVLSLVILPHSSEVAPAPSAELLNCVERYLDRRKDPHVTLCLVAPQYLRLHVHVDFVARAWDDAWDEGQDIERSVTSEIARFLHPLTGGPRGTGWDLGKRPQESHVAGRIEALVGIDHVRHLTIEATEDYPGLEQSRYFLVCSGKHTVRQRPNDIKPAQRDAGI